VADNREGLIEGRSADIREFREFREFREGADTLP
jgi:hypothetical protein